MQCKLKKQSLKDLMLRSAMFRSSKAQSELAIL